MEIQKSIIGKWVGDSFGTHRYNVYAEFYIDEKNVANVSAEIRGCLLSNNSIAVFYGESREVQTKSISFILKEYINNQPTENILSLNMEEVDPETLQGDWETTVGGKGLISLSKSRQLTEKPELEEPIEILSREYKFDNLTVYAKDINKIINLLEDFVKPDGKVFVTENSDGTKISSFAKAFLKREKDSRTLEELIIFGQRTDKGINSIITVDLKRREESKILVQAPDLIILHSFPLGLKEILDKGRRKVVGFYKRYGLNINSIVFLSMLVILPSLQMKERLSIVISYVIFIILHFLIHKNSSYSAINFNKDMPTLFKEKHPTISYLAQTAFSAAVAVGIKFILEKIFASPAP